MATHLAAVHPAKGQALVVQSRPTPKPGPGELLVAVKSVGLNPANVLIRDHGIFVSTYPTVTGFDLSGLVLEIGENVPTGGPTDGSSLSFQPGVTRVIAYSAGAFKASPPDYGAFQEKCLVPWQHAVPISESGISWNHAATLPVAVQVPLNAWDDMGIPRMGGVMADAAASSQSASSGTNAENQKGNADKREALLVWGASSSVGTMGVQTGRLLREDPSSDFAAVYATAGAHNLTYISSLGADRVFDYRDSQVVDAIVAAAKKDGLVIRHCFLATGQLAPCQAVLKAFLEGDQKGNETKASIIGSSPIVPADAEVIEGMKTIHVMPKMHEEELRLQQYQYWLGTWLRINLNRGNIKPSPEPTVVGKGLEWVNVGLDQLAKGVSCTKLVVVVAE